MNCEIPEDLSCVSLPGHNGSEYRIVLDRRIAGSYDWNIATARDYGYNARLLNAFLKGRGTLIDLGANIGTICLPAAAAGSCVIAVEMLPSNVQKLRFSVQVNKFEHFVVIDTAVSDEDGEIGYSGDEAFAQVTTDVDAPKVTALKLDTIITRLEEETPGLIVGPLAIKLDIEGHELAAFKGATAIMAKHRPFVLFESIVTAAVDSYVPPEVKVLLENLGYQMFMTRGTILSPHASPDRQLGLVSDIVAIPKESLHWLDELGAPYEVRPLTADEDMAWLDEMYRDSETHIRHANALIPHLAARWPDRRQEIEQREVRLAA